FSFLAVAFHAAAVTTVLPFLMTPVTWAWNAGALGPVKASTATRRLASATPAVASSARSAISAAATRRALLVEAIDLELVMRGCSRWGFGQCATLPLLVGAARHAAEHQGEVGRAGRVLDGFFVRHQALLDQAGQALIEGRHAVGVKPLGDGVLDLAGALGRLDELAHPFRIHHHLECRHHALAVGARQE